MMCHTYLLAFYLIHNTPFGQDTCAGGRGWSRAYHCGHYHHTSESRLRNSLQAAIFNWMWLGVPHPIQYATVMCFVEDFRLFGTPKCHHNMQPCSGPSLFGRNLDGWHLSSVQMSRFWMPKSLYKHIQIIQFEVPYFNPSVMSNCTIHFLLIYTNTHTHIQDVKYALDVHPQSVHDDTSEGLMYTYYQKWETWNTSCTRKTVDVSI